MSVPPFAPSAALTLGVEEELMLVDAETFAQRPAAAAVVAAAAGRELPGRLKSELFAGVLEANTEPCDTATEALAALRALRRAAAELAAAHGLAVVAAGTHPTDLPEEQEIAPEQRYLDFVEFAGVSARRQGVQGLHVHVGMPDAEACVRVLDGLLPWLPLLLALSANSPYLAGRETGLASNRAEVLAQLPRSGAPPAFASWREWEEFLGRLLATGAAANATALWWDARPHPAFGTLEVRVVDQPTSVERSGAFVALVQALCATLLAGEVEPFGESERALYAENRWRAARFGPRAQLVPPEGDALVSVPELTQRLLELVEPQARALGVAGLLAGLDGHGCEGDAQLEAGRRGGLREVCAELAARSVASQ